MLLTEMTIELILTQWPQTAVLLRRYQMTACFGCQVSPFCTVEEAINLYHLPRDLFLTELEQSISQAKTNKGNF